MLGTQQVLVLSRCVHTRVCACVCGRVAESNISKTYNDKYFSLHFSRHFYSFGEKEQSHGAAEM